MAFVAHTSISFVGLIQPSSLRPWVLDSDATNHITGNKSLFFSLSSLNNLLMVTMADESRVLSHGVSIVNLFSISNH